MYTGRTMYTYTVSNETKHIPAGKKNLKNLAGKENDALKTITHKRQCHFCGSLQMIPSGTCFVCLSCGSSLGCS